MRWRGRDGEAREVSETRENVGVSDSGAHGAGSGQSLSMHDGVEVWCDCCPCEAEPYWAEVAAELGIVLD
ncbi:MAG: hypothetical protein ACQETK_04130 [Pseudomonadota bacterium]